MNEERKPTKSQLPHEVPAGQETAVPKGMIPAVGVIPHPDQNTYPGVLVMARNHDEVVSWHRKDCDRKGIRPEAILFDSKGAPWCNTCYKQNQFQSGGQWDYRKLPCGPEFPRWEADTTGAVFRDGALIKPLLNKRGYLVVSADRQNQIKGPVAVHTLVLYAFEGPMPKGMGACHKNDIKTDNHPWNLRWGAHSENVLDSVENGTHARLSGERNPGAKITQKIVDQIRDDYSRNPRPSWRDLSIKYGISKRQVGRILNNESWSDIAINPPEKFGD